MPLLESEADRASYFEEAETAQIRTVNVPGQFDERTEFLEGVGPVALQSTNPVFLCQSVNVPADLEEGEPISITRQDGTIFLGTVITNEPDGFGLTTLNLQADG